MILQRLICKIGTKGKAARSTKWGGSSSASTLTPSPMSFSGTLSEPENHCFIYRQPEKKFGLEENGLELYFRKMNPATQRQISEGKGQSRKTNYETFATELMRMAHLGYSDHGSMNWDPMVTEGEKQKAWCD